MSVQAARLGIQVNEPPPTNTIRSQKQSQTMAERQCSVLRVLRHQKIGRWRAEAGLVLFTCQFVSQLYSGIFVSIFI